MDHADEDEDEDLPPLNRLHSMYGIPADAREMGLDRNVPEGAWLAFAGSLSPARPSHRLVAWLLLAVFVMPLLLTLKATLF